MLYILLLQMKDIRKEIKFNK